MSTCAMLSSKAKSQPGRTRSQRSASAAEPLRRGSTTMIFAPRRRASFKASTAPIVDESTMDRPKYMMQSVWAKSDAGL